MPAIRESFDRMVGNRVRVARKALKLTQEQLSERLGFNDRQILSNIEAGKRRVQADELVAFMGALNKDLDYFTDPYLVAEEKVISWRAKRETPEIDRYEPVARNLVSSFRRFRDLLDISFNPVLPRLPLTRRSSYEDAAAAAEALVRHWQLGDRPADEIWPLIEEKLGIYVLFVDAPQDVSGAACHLPQFNAILINRREVPWRRNFTLAHDAFHLMTWDAMPPESVDIEYHDMKRAPKIERLANNFAAALLMPRSAVASLWEARDQTADVHNWIVESVDAFGVSGEALYWRLRNLGLLTEGMAQGINRDRLKRSNGQRHAAALPKLYSKSFVKVLHDVLDQGRVSVRKAAGLLRCDIEDIENLFTAYDIAVPFAL